MSAGGALRVLAAAIALLAACGGESGTPVAPGVRAESDAPVADRPAQAAAASDAERIAGLGSENSALALRLARSEAQVAALEEELTREREKRMERERAWLDHNRAVANLPLGSIAGLASFPVELDPDVQRDLKRIEEAAEVPPPDPLLERGAELGRKLRALFAADSITGMDLLEAGRVGPGLEAPGWTGPAVLRLVDGEGRLSGGLYAERLRLEASRAARMVTLVLEEGYESHGGLHLPFADGVRRILLPGVDTERWIEACPELFPRELVTAPRDDGLWDLGRVRAALNELLREDAGAGYHQVRFLGGVVDGVLRDVQLAAYDARGHLQRRLFADRMAIQVEQEGVLVLLEDGASMRGDQHAGFLDGRMRLYLPRAHHEDWRAARLPGLAEPDRLPAAAFDAPLDAGTDSAPGGDSPEPAPAAGDISPAPAADGDGR